MATQLRLDKLLSDTGRWSRKEAKLLLKQGRVRVDAQVERAAERKVDPASQRVEVDGAQVIWAKFRYLMLNKPGGVLTATEDRRQKTVLDLLPEEYRSLFPVGRLDKDTEGLLLLTDDGELAHRLLSPRHHVDKVYLAEIDGQVNHADTAAFEAGLTLGDGTQLYARRAGGSGPRALPRDAPGGQISSGQAYACPAGQAGDRAETALHGAAGAGSGAPAGRIPPPDD